MVKFLYGKKDQIIFHTFERNQIQTTIHDPSFGAKVIPIIFLFNLRRYKRSMGLGTRQGNCSEITASIRITLTDVVFSLKYINQYPDT
jgi:hypothetical protein